MDITPSSRENPVAYACSTDVKELFLSAKELVILERLILFWERGKNIWKDLGETLWGIFSHLGALVFIFVLNCTQFIFYFLFYFFPPLPRMIRLSFMCMKGRKEFKISRGFEVFLTLTSPHVKSFFSTLNGFTSMWFSIM